MQLLGDKDAVRILFEKVAPRFADRNGGYTRILKLSKPRLGDGGERAILEFVGVRDRVIERSQKPAFSDEEDRAGESESPQPTGAETAAGQEPSPAAEQPSA
jgi:large subunit ribosomal protein L17